MPNKLQGVDKYSLINSRPIIDLSKILFEHAKDGEFFVFKVIFLGQKSADFYLLRI